MKKTIYIAVIINLFIYNSYAEQFNVAENYKGKSDIQSLDLIQLEKDCTEQIDFWQMTNSEREKIRKNCPINQIAFYFQNLYETINNKKNIYNSEKLNLIIEKNISTKIINNTKYPVKALNLSMFNKTKFMDKINLAKSYYDVDGYYWLINQYYYISDDGDIYTSLLKDIDVDVKPIFWKHYQIDKKNFHFNLIDLLIDDGYKYEIIYPDHFRILEGSLKETPYEIDKVKTCYQKEYTTGCSIDSYRFYHNILSEKIEMLKEKDTNNKESIEIIDKQINKKCLSISEPNDHFEAEKFTYNITKCLTRQLKKKIKKIDQRLEVL
ncbi:MULTISPECIES: hypothetical protein [Snodgrassella]|uniref:hypothetical protein n=1 Tax=Snodgrassella TaxID=1193515 RepID=UPI000996589D|nr:MULTISPECIES: hypothetical protein [Snodgrassella]MBI0097804.1 hypothetical protein [Snodgrassella sp. W8134]MBI0100463.1 hypothetical protein [Snodgrassella sp. W8135]MBI0130449.1 hypothetical protein [Snodgrassella sp. W8124]NUE81465.1 hypothetical protein [Snodgrassella sp. ESL0304]OOX79007.1 hypothetical protein BGH94_05455 [Snodgrassella alvi]